MSAGEAAWQARHQTVLSPVTVDAAGVATLLGVSPRTVRKLDATGGLPQALRIGRRKLWRVDELREWAAAGAPTREEWESRR